MWTVEWGIVQKLIKFFKNLSLKKNFFLNFLLKFKKFLKSSQKSTKHEINYFSPHPLKNFQISLSRIGA
jgi:hypothetical protein